MCSTGERKDRFRGFNFRVEVEGITRAGFREASGLNSAQNPTEHRVNIDRARKLPSLNTYSTISLKWGVTDDAELWAWRKHSIDGKIERRNGSIILCDDGGEEKSRWNFVKGWPTKWTGPTFNATDGEVAIETLEIAHEGLTRE